MDKLFDASVDQEVRTKLYYLFDYEGEAIIGEKRFKHVMAIWSAFSANDINNDNELDSNEVKTLFWLFDGAKPTMEKIQRETAIMDSDKSGTIDRLEWLAYLCSSGTGNKDYYDFELRAMFEKADADKDGQISQSECIAFLKMDMAKIIKSVDEQERW